MFRIPALALASMLVLSACAQDSPPQDLSELQVVSSRSLFSPVGIGPLSN